MRARRIVIMLAVACCLAGAAVAALRQPWAEGDVDPASAQNISLTKAREELSAPQIEGPDPQRSDLGAHAAKGTAERLVHESAVVLAQRQPDRAGIKVDPGDLDEFAMGSALEEIVAQAEYNAREKWVQSGQPKVVWAKVDPAKSNATTMVAAVCLDNSDVALRDATGATLPPSPHPRTINLYVFRKHAGAWKVAEHSFPTKPDC